MSGGRTGQRGQVTFLGVGLAIGLLMVGGFSVDLWRVLSARRELAEVADAAAAAGANGLDLGHYRRTGELRLDPGLAVALAGENLRQQALDGDRPPRVTRLDADTARVVVELEGEVPLTLLRLFTVGEPITVTVAAEAVPVRGP
jgi:Flp pilus assembly protein TadG